MPTKKAARKNSEETIKDPLISLYFVQGKEMLLEGVGDLGDAPKLSIVTRTYYTAEEAEAANKLTGAKVGDDNYKSKHTQKDTRHTDAALHKNENGTYTFFVPDIYKRDDAEKYLIDDQIYEVESFTIDNYKAWNKHMWQEKLYENFVEQTEVRKEIAALEPSDKEKESLQNDIERQGKALESLKQTYDRTLLDLDTDFETVEKQLQNLAGRISLTVAALKEKEARLMALRAGVKTMENAKLLSPLRERLEALTEASNKAYAQFFYDISENENVTKQAFEGWYETLSDDDKDNISIYVAAGNARRMSGRAVGPLTREQERARELKKLVN